MATITKRDEVLKVVQVRIMIPTMTLIERRALEDAIDEVLARWPNATMSITTNTPRIN